MGNARTIAIFGAGTGLGLSLARRFGNDGSTVALVARRADALGGRVSQLRSEGIEAFGFPADLTDLDSLPDLVRSIENQLGCISVAIYCPVSPDARFVPATTLDAATLQTMAPLFVFAPVEVARAVLPGMLERGDGAIVVVSGITAVAAIPGLSGVGPLMAATRNYVLTLGSEVAAHGIYAGTVSIAAVIAGSESHAAIGMRGSSIDPIPVVDPDDIAAVIWSMVAERDRQEAIIPTETRS